MMTKTAKAVIFFIRMRLHHSYITGQVILFFCLLFCACNGKQDENIIPPLTSPLSGNSIGFGVIKTSFTHVIAEPKENSASLGYLRRGALVRVVERRIVNDSGGSQSWVMVDTEQKGWLREEVMDIYDNESRAKTAARSMSR